MMKRIPIALSITLLVTACESGDERNRVVGELASDRIELTAEFGEPIVAIDVEEGDTVAAGQILLHQNDARAKARLADATAAYLQAKARLDELVRGPRQELIAAARANVRGTTQELEFRRSEIARITEIHERGLTSAEALDKAQAALDAASAARDFRRAQLEELLAGTTIEELTQAEQFAKQAAARRDAARIDLERHTVVAPVDGILDSRLFEIGERPGIGQPVLVLLGGDQPFARVYVPEHLRVELSPGMAANVFVDGLSDPLAGKIRWIATESVFTPYFALTERDRGRLSFVAKIDIVEARERLPDGVPLEVEFLLD